MSGVLECVWEFWSRGLFALTRDGLMVTIFGSVMIVWDVHTFSNLSCFSVVTTMFLGAVAVLWIRMFAMLVQRGALVTCEGSELWATKLLVHRAPLPNVDWFAPTSTMLMHRLSDLLPHCILTILVEWVCG